MAFSALPIPPVYNLYQEPRRNYFRISAFLVAHRNQRLKTITVSSSSCQCSGNVFFFVLSNDIPHQNSFTNKIHDNLVVIDRDSQLSNRWQRHQWNLSVLVLSYWHRCILKYDTKKGETDRPFNNAPLINDSDNQRLTASLKASTSIAATTQVDRSAATAMAAATIYQQWISTTSTR